MNIKVYSLKKKKILNITQTFEQKLNFDNYLGNNFSTIQTN